MFHSNANTAAAVAAVVYFLLYFAEIAVVLKGFPLPVIIVLVSTYTVMLLYIDCTTCSV